MGVKDKLQARYTEADKARFFALYEASKDPISGYGNVVAAAQAAGIVESTARTWVKSRPEVKEKLEESGAMEGARVDLAEKLEEVAEFMIGLIPEKAIHADLGKLVPAISMAIEKSRLLRGQAGTIHETIINENDLLAEMRKLGVPIKDEPSESEILEARLSQS